MNREQLKASVLKSLKKSPVAKIGNRQVLVLGEKAVDYIENAERTLQRAAGMASNPDAKSYFSDAAKLLGKAVGEINDGMKAEDSS